MSLPLQTLAQFVQAATQAWGASIGIAPSFASGDPLLAIFQGTGSQALFLQAQAQVVNAVARAQTSTGVDVDTFLAQFDFTRLPAKFASGDVVYTAPNPAPTAVYVYPGAVISTPGGAVTYSVVADQSQPNWNEATGAYVLPANATSMTVTAQANVGGSAYNVTAGQLTVATTPIPGISGVSNPNPITNGLNAESDAAALARFVLWLNSLSKATEGSIEYAILTVQVGIMFNLLENTNPSGATAYGQFVAVIDDGSGSPPSSLITAAQNAISAVDGFTILGTALAVVQVNPTIALSVRVASGYMSSVVTAAVKAALAALVLQIGETLFISADITTVAQGVAGVVSVQAGVLINGEPTDLVPTGFQRIIILAANVAVGTY